MIKQKEIISLEEIQFTKESFSYDMDKDGNRIAEFALPLVFDPEEKLDLQCGESSPNLYIQVTEEKRKKKKRAKLYISMYMNILNAPGRPEYDWDRILLLPGQIKLFIKAIDDFLKKAEPGVGSYYGIFDKFKV